MSKPSMVGVSGSTVLFLFNNKIYQTSAIAVSDASSLTVKVATGLVNSGQATPAAKSYLSQFPWTGQ